MSLLFGTDGIRGVANRELTVETVLALGRAAARVLHNGQSFVVGRDTRRSGPMLESALVAGLCAEGVDVALAGVLSTPGVAYLARVREAPAAVVSASHNPSEDNGVKLLSAGGRKLSDALERQIELLLDELVEELPENGPTGRGVGVVSELRNPLEEYVAHVVGVLEGRRLDRMRVVLDCGNGASFRAAPMVFRQLGAHVDLISATPDGSNINEGCGATDPSLLARSVVELGADVGLAFDGDADRMIAVDDTGALVDGDQIIGIMALDLRARGELRENAVVVTVMSNMGLRLFLGEHGIEVVESPVGDRHVLDAMEQRGVSLGGEQSGHIVFGDVATTGDGVLTGALLLDVVRRRRTPLARLAGAFTRWPQVKRSVAVRDRAAIDGNSRFWDVARRAADELGEDGRLLVRPSGTEPVVRVMVEATTTTVAEAIADELAAAVVECCGRPD